MDTGEAGSEFQLPNSVEESEAKIFLDIQKLERRIRNMGGERTFNGTVTNIKYDTPNEDLLQRRIGARVRVFKPKF